MGLRSWLLTVATKLDNILYSLGSAISLGYSASRKHPRQTRLNVSCTKKQRSVTVTLNTLIHDKLTKRYLVARSCIISV
jgi:DNA-binding sugar fermentation-stimulating protein